MDDRAVQNRKISFALFLLAVFSMPFLFNNYLNPLFPPPVAGRLQVSDIFFLLSIVFFAASAFGNRPRLPDGLFGLSLAVYLAAAFLSAIFSKNTRIAVVECAGTLYLASFVVLGMNLIDTSRRLRIAVFTLLCSAAAVSLAGIAGYLMARFTGIDNYMVRYYSIFMNGEWRLVSTLILPNMAYGFLQTAFFIGAGAILFKDGPKKAWVITALMLIFAAIILTFSRGYTAFMLGLCVFLGMVRREKIFTAGYIKPLIYMIGVLTIMLFIIVQIFITFATDVSFSFEKGRSNTKSVDHAPHKTGVLFKDDMLFPAGRQYDEFRMKVTYIPGFYLYMNRLAIQMFASRPIFGVGPGNFGASVLSLCAVTKDTEIKEMSETFSGKPHSTYFGALAEGGIAGFTALLLLFVFFWLDLSRAIRTAGPSPARGMMISAIAAVAGLSLFGWNVDIMNFRWLWIVFGIGLAAKNVKGGNG